MNQPVEDVLRLAKGLQTAAPIRIAPGGSLRLFDEIVTETKLKAVAGPLFRDGHYAQAVEEGFKFLNNLVKSKAGHPREGVGRALDGASLMLKAFSANAPILKFSDLASESKRNFQMGYMHILEGCMIGIRNPRAHDYGYPDDSRNALELLAFCNHLVKVVNQAKRSRGKRSARRMSQSQVG